MSQGVGLRSLARARAAPLQSRPVAAGTAVVPEKVSQAHAVTRTHHGQLGHLKDVGSFKLDHRGLLRDDKGHVKAGVGIYLQHDAKELGVYVAALTPGGPAEASGLINVRDFVVSIDGINVSHDSEMQSHIERCQGLILGQAGSSVHLVFDRAVGDLSEAQLEELQSHGGFYDGKPLRYEVHLVRRQVGQTRRRTPSRQIERQTPVTDMVEDDVEIVDPDMFERKLARTNQRAHAPGDMLSTADLKLQLEKLSAEYLALQDKYNALLAQHLHKDKPHVDERQHKVLRHVVGRWRHRTLARASDSWKAHAAKQKRMQNLGIKVVRRWICKQLFNTLTSWRRRTVQLCRARAIFSRAIRKIRNLKLSRAWAVYVDHVKQQKGQRLLLKKMVRHWEYLKIAQPFMSWQANAKKQRKIEDTCNRLVSRWKNAVLWSAYEAWHVAAKDQRRAKDVCTRTVSHMKHRRLAIAFDTFHIHADEQHRVNALCCKIVMRMKNALSYSALISWQANAKKQRKIEDTCNRLVSRWKNAVLWSAYEAWHVNATCQRRAEDVCTRIVCHLMHRHKAVAFDAFFENTRKQHQAEENCQRILAKWSFGKLWPSFRRWRGNARALSLHRSDAAKAYAVDQQATKEQGLTRTKSCPQLTSNERNLYSAPLQIMWCQLVDEFYALAKENIFQHGNAITWAEFLERSRHHAKTALPYLLFDHKTNKVQIIDADFSRIPNLELLPLPNEETVQGSRSGSKDENSSELQGPSFFDSVVGGMMIMARVKSSQQLAPYVRLQQLERRNASLQAHCSQLERENDVLLLKSLEPCAQAPKTIRGMVCNVIIDDSPSNSSRMTPTHSESIKNSILYARRAKERSEASTVIQPLEHREQKHRTANHGENVGSWPPTMHHVRPISPQSAQIKAADSQAQTQRFYHF